MRCHRGAQTDTRSSTESPRMLRQRRRGTPRALPADSVGQQQHQMPRAAASNARSSAIECPQEQTSNHRISSISSISSHAAHRISNIISNINGHAASVSGGRIAAARHHAVKRMWRQLDHHQREATIESNPKTKLDPKDHVRNRTSVVTELRRAVQRAWRIDAWLQSSHIPRSTIEIRETGKHS